MRVWLVGATVVVCCMSASSAAGERAWYASIEGGVASVDFSAQQGAVTCPFSPLFPPPTCISDDSTSSGAAIVGAFGHRVDERFRIEGELGYRSNEIGGFDTLEHTTLMVNGAWDIPLTESLSFSLGAGVGIDWLSSSETSQYLPLAPSDATAFAYQGMAGLSYAVTDSVAITASYRRLETTGGDGIVVITEAKLAPPSLATPPAAVLPPGLGSVLVDDVSADTVSIGLRISF